MNRTLVEMARSMIYHMGVDRSWWDEVKVEVPDLNKNNEDDEMDVDETADNDTSWEDMVVDASGDLNQSQNLDVVPIEGERTDIQVIDTNNSMIRRTSHGSVAGSSNYGTHMLSGIPDQSRAIIVCENSRAPDDRMEIYSGSNKRPYSTFTSSRLLTNDDFDDERIDLPLLTDGSPVDGENDEPDPKRQCVDDYEISLSATDVPINLREALQSMDAEKWKAAIQAEINAHLKNHTWDAVNRPPGVKVIGHKWVFGYKYDENGQIVRYKARLVALGYLQTHGFDYFDTYSPEACSNTIRVFLSVCCSMQYVIRQFDVETAFLNGDLEEDVYMEAPYGIEIAPGMVCKLRRSLYGLKQAAAVWHKKTCSVFSAMGFEQCRADTCLFVRRNNAKNKSPTYIVLYVDDLLIGCKSDAEADTIYKELSEHFTVKSLGAARFILGMEVNCSQEKGELVLKQSQFIMKVVSKFKQNEAYAVRNPICAGQDLTPDESHPVVKDITSYRKLVGSLLYISNATRPDISYAMSVLSQYLDQPRQRHWRAALRVLHYLMGTKSHGIKYNKSDDKKMMLWAYCDANWGNDKKLVDLRLEC
ncbi:unnamed protein product [Peronospora farinosa]|uniref:Reverse transcriptase Ty1/copia-type domain-containing protein n=1 Tax=Peronospora farinosa TaxID=134698 RepID=A0AAV0U5Q0_9STRA|nr:unnamed protein product [Peronospora farinosa]